MFIDLFHILSFRSYSSLSAVSINGAFIGGFTHHNLARDLGGAKPQTAICSDGFLDRHFLSVLERWVLIYSLSHGRLLPLRNRQTRVRLSHDKTDAAR
jgi:hypothetical protein